MGRREAREGGRELVGPLHPREGAAGREVRVADDGREPVGGLTGEQHDVVGRQVGEGAGGLRTEEPRLGLLPGQAQHGARRCPRTCRLDPAEQVGLTLAALEAHPPQPLPRPVVALEELGLHQPGLAQQREPALVVDDDEPDLDLVEEAGHLGRVHVLGQQQGHAARHAGGQLELELADPGGDADDDDLSGVDPGLDHARGAVDDAPVELVPGERGPRVAALLRDRHLEGAAACVTRQPRERRWLDRHLRPLHDSCTAAT